MVSFLLLLCTWCSVCLVYLDHGIALPMFGKYPPMCLLKVFSMSLTWNYYYYITTITVIISLTPTALITADWKAVAVFLACVSIG